MTDDLRPALIFATDENYFHLAKTLVHSLHENVFPQRRVPVACLDIGLSKESRDCLQRAGVTIHDPDIRRIPPALRPLVEERPYMMAQFYRPFFNELVDGDLCIHIDCDAWLQNADLIEACVSGVTAFPDRMLLSPLRGHYTEPFYNDLENVLRLYKNWTYACYDKPWADKLSNMAYYSSGVFAARTDCGVWAKWAAEIARIVPLVSMLNPQALHLAEQTALNGVVRFEATVTALDPIYNFHCNSGGVYRDDKTGKVMTALVWPQREISVVHLAAWEAMREAYQIRQLVFEPKTPFPV